MLIFFFTVPESLQRLKEKEHALEQERRQLERDKEYNSQLNTDANGYSGV